MVDHLEISRLRLSVSAWIRVSILKKKWLSYCKSLFFLLPNYTWENGTLKYGILPDAGSCRHALGVLLLVTEITFFFCDCQQHECRLLLLFQSKPWYPPKPHRVLTLPEPNRTATENWEHSLKHLKTIPHSHLHILFFFFVMVKCGKWKAVHFVQHYIEVKGKTHMQDTDTGRPHNSRVRDPFIQEDFLCRVFLYTVSPWLPKGFPAEHFSLNHEADYHFHCTKMWGRIRITEARAEKVTEGSPKNVACCKTVPLWVNDQLREWWFYCDIEYSGLFATFHHKQKYNIYFAAIKYHVCTDHTFSDTNTKQVWLDEDDLAQDTTAPLLSATGEKHNRAEGILFPPKSIRRPHILLL